MYVDIHGKSDPKVAAVFKRQLRAQCKGVGEPLTLELPRVAMAGREIAVVFARANSRWTVAEQKTFASMLERGIAVLPVVPDPDAAKGLPSCLSHINAFVRSFFGDAWAECLADEVLSIAWLHRRTPKVFISYKRTDSGPIAAQLYDRFNHLGYETFFDEASVPRGADFQRELMWWLNDADLLIVLASPNFPLSKWCMKEVSFCQDRSIGVVAVDWPDAVYGRERRLPFPGVDDDTKKPRILNRATPDQVLVLRGRDFAASEKPRKGRDPDLPSRELTAEALSRVLAMCARQRTVAIGQRLRELVPLALRALPGAAPMAGVPTGSDLVFHDTSGVESFVRVVPFRPRPETIRQAAIDGVAYGAVAYGAVAGCFYAENDPLDPRAQALRWLANGKRPPNPTQSDGWVWAYYRGIMS